MLVQKELGVHYCSECREGPQTCVVLSADFEQVVLCQTCYAEVGTLFDVSEDELKDLPDDAPEWNGHTVLRVGVDVYDGDLVFFWADGTKLVLNGWQDGCTRDTGISSNLEGRTWRDESSSGE